MLKESIEKNGRSGGIDPRSAIRNQELAVFVELIKLIMNWKLLIGIFLILGGLKIFFTQTNAYLAGSMKDYPLAAQSGSAALMLAGIYLVYRGRKKPPTPTA